jgi:hypothetical protein
MLLRFALLTKKKHTLFLSYTIEFRHMTLQVIGEAVLSMSHDECDRTLPALYLPVVQGIIVLNL